MKTDDYTKQVPLVFALMSGEKTKDYKAVIKAVLEMLPVPKVDRDHDNIFINYWADNKTKRLLIVGQTRSTLRQTWLTVGRTRL